MIYNCLNDEQEGQEINDQLESMLAIFKPRTTFNQATCISLDRYIELLDMLTCSICLELLRNPVYLKCSHRFCKDCIQKHVRRSYRKACPNCKLPLTSKDLKSDLEVADIAICAVGDPELFRLELQCIQQFLASHKRSKVQYEEYGQDWQALITNKRFKQEPMKRDKDLKEEQQQQEETWQNVINQFCPIVGIQKDFSKLENMQVENSQNKCRQYGQNNRSGITEVSTQFIKKQLLEIKTLNKSAQQVYGYKYFKQMTQILREDIYLQIQLRYHPLKPMTPPLPFRTAKFSSLSPCTAITALIGHIFNISKKLIKLLVFRNGFNQIAVYQRLAYINEKFWESNEMNLLNLAKIEWKSLNVGEDSCKGTSRIIYYQILI